MNNKIILYVGRFGSPHLDESIVETLENTSTTVYIYKTGKYFHNTSFFFRIQYYLGFGIPFFKCYFSFFLYLYKLKKNHKVFNIFFRRPIEFSSLFFLILKFLYKDIYLYAWHNDNIFSNNQKGLLWKKARKTIKYFDIIYSFRESDNKKFYDYGAKNVELWLPYYTPKLHFIPNTHNDNYKNSVLFITHAEKDMRGECFEILFQNKISSILHSYNWNKIFPNTDPMMIKGPLYGEEYNIAINSSLVTVCFFSKLNEDMLTMRVFEIPACGGLLLCERNNIVTKILIENEEAFYFSDKYEFLNKIYYIMRNSAESHRVRINGINKIKTIGKIEQRVEHFINNLR